VPEESTSNSEVVTEQQFKNIEQQAWEEIWTSDEKQLEHSLSSELHHTYWGTWEPSSKASLPSWWAWRKIPPKQVSNFYCAISKLDSIIGICWACTHSTTSTNQFWLAIHLNIVYPASTPMQYLPAPMFTQQTQIPVMGMPQQSMVPGVLPGVYKQPSTVKLYYKE
jgi:hypothetical protein